MTAAAVEPVTPPTLELRDVDAGYGPFRAIFGVSLAVPAGGVLAILGSNGAGKTTIARVSSGLIRPTSGQVLFDGNDITGKHTFEYARARHRARPRRPLGVRLAHGRGEPRAHLPSQPGPGGRPSRARRGVPAVPASG